jgi:hypothetical protein
MRRRRATLPWKYSRDPLFLKAGAVACGFYIPTKLFDWLLLGFRIDGVQTSRLAPNGALIVYDPRASGFKD